jgi:transcriptional regulator of acetoin/glycerol metabolism
MRYEDVPAMNDDDARLWEWLAALGAGAEADHAAVALARAIVAIAGAERAFVALADEAGRVEEAWGADLDGLAIANAAQRVSSELVAAALRSDGPVYLREARSAAGTGSRLAIASPARAVVVVEHRFAPARFDGVDAARAARWATCASLLARRTPELAAVELTGPAALAAYATASSTSVPLRAARRSFPTILGESPALARALARLDAAIDSDLPVLITGETGAGKEVFARALHEHGARASRPFVAVNCASIPDALFEAELFGHARGSFTGAERARGGLIARAQGGTLLLDEIGDLPLPRQASLLRALETRRFRPVGSDDEQPFDVRIVAATNRDLARLVREGTFRQDLLFRLQVLEIPIPPLRARAEDIPLLARAFLTPDLEIAPQGLAALAAYGWPGNVRELMHQMQRLGALKVARIDVEHLPREIRGSLRDRPRSITRAETERDEVARALAISGGNITHAAARLGLTRHGLKKRMLRLGMRAKN